MFLSHFYLFIIFKQVLDLFCGVGNFTLPLAKLAKSVVGIEWGAQMVQNAALNAKRNNLNNCEFIEADLITGKKLIELLAGKVFLFFSFSFPF
jgi:tRNA/tmRNA/rRNA uracil-C5-methylase (TrmA/RlmC/RlmD family)